MATCGVWCLVLLTLSIGRLSSAGPPGQNWGKYSISYCLVSSVIFGEKQKRDERLQDVLFFKDGKSFRRLPDLTFVPACIRHRSN